MLDKSLLPKSHLHSMVLLGTMSENRPSSVTTIMHLSERRRNQ
ncbi:MAG: hypothetical protein AVDCRST_MAG74-569 [uncultured Pyrinomonadaceae bacterium]|uniref:Uncharacterized protein n=1 Tax=uncultured Pyrinomonadaceae bacterium TaxID=2283094 RepID=A0A6J4NC06_9BACT|nr:MAG: hypothetical protein AVDCRST_MAG74-569 [uncultured Pyrinomonadaceae bacterium]